LLKRSRRAKNPGLRWYFEREIEIDVAGTVARDAAEGRREWDILGSSQHAEMQSRREKRTEAFWVICVLFCG
jgi:hypothetical protein